ncbi:MAG: hypothetical protein J1E01_05960 [Acetatifactor sp.]|nr:hypothetical protein [Acetatifactor sp.]
MALTLTTEDLQAIANLLDEKLDHKLDEKLDQKLAPINKRLDTIDNRLDKLESQTDALRASQIDIKKELKALDDKISETYQVTLDAWGTSTENRKLLEAAN